jgi:hypothetical protein
MIRYETSYSPPFTVRTLVTENMADQNERAFQKQPTIFLNKKGGLKPSESRFFCNPGLGFKTPVEAKNGNYIDKKCPFTGKVRGFYIVDILADVGLCVATTTYPQQVKFKIYPLRDFFMSLKWCQSIGIH